MSSPHPRFRQTHKWRQAASAVIADAKREGLACGLCGGVVLYDARPRTRYAPSVDHLEPLSRGGHPTDRRNLQLVHVGCNSRKGGARLSRTKNAGVETVTLLVCDGRACFCAQIGDGRPQDYCRNGPPRTVRFVRNEHGWVEA